jgi:hypothetical protein
MPTPTYTPLATVTLGSSASSVTFSSIPATYRDLILIHSSKHTFAGSTSVRDSGIRFNSDSGSNYLRVNMDSKIDSGTATETSIALIYGRVDGNFVPGIVQIMDYSATNKHKTVLYRSGAANDYVYAQAARWANTAAVTTITIAPSGSFQIIAGSTFALYGVIA